MAGAIARGVLFVHSAPRALCPHVEWAAGNVLGGRVSFEWTEQPAGPGFFRAEYSWQGAQGNGARLASALRGWAHLRYEITEFERPYKVTVRAENGSTISEDTITFTTTDRREVDGVEVGSQTEVRYDADLRLKGAFRVLDPVIGLLFNRIGDRAAGGLRAALLDRAELVDPPAT